MSERKINLEDIIFKNHSNMHDFKRDFPKVHQLYLDSMVEFGKQLLELAAENANTKTIEFISCKLHTTTMVIDKQSILNTINQVK
jgi:hypothetical protein